jgi:hypothetical protein
VSGETLCKSGLWTCTRSSHPPDRGNKLQASKALAAYDFLPKLSDVAGGIPGVNNQPGMPHHKLIIVRRIVCGNQHGIVSGQVFRAQLHRIEPEIVAAHLVQLRGIGINECAKAAKTGCGKKAENPKDLVLAVPKNRWCGYQTLKLRTYDPLVAAVC